MCTSCVYTLPFRTHRPPRRRAGRFEVVRQRSKTMMKRRRYVHTLFLYTMLLVRFVHASCLYTNVYVMFVHTSFPYPQTTPAKSRKIRGGKAPMKPVPAKIERDEDSEVEELQVSNNAVCTLFLYTIVLVGFVHNYVHHVCTQCLRHFPVLDRGSSLLRRNLRLRLRRC